MAAVTGYGGRVVACEPSTTSREAARAGVMARAGGDEIIAAMMLIWKRMKIVAEPSSAVPLATLPRNPDIFAGKRVGVIITGGNVDLDRFPWIRG